MSWSISATGSPEDVLKAIEEHTNNSLTGQSRQEWDEAKPALAVLVGANKGRNVSLAANGHATFDNHQGGDGATKTYGSVDVTLKSA